MDLGTLSDVRLRHQKIDLGDGSPSVIQFSIHPNSTHLQRFMGPNFRYETEAQIVGPDVQIDEQQFLGRDHEYTSNTTISNMLSSLEIDSDGLELLILVIIAKAHLILFSNFTSGNKKWLMTVEMHLVTTTFSLRDARIRRLISMAGRSNLYGMVPATGSSIAALEEGRLHVGDESCTICLEDLLEGSLVTRMPCSHVFHSKCIVQWLNTSHYCPTCRFEMPT